MRKTGNIFIVSIIAMLAVASARADVASKAYVDASVQVGAAATNGGETPSADAGKIVVVGDDGKIAKGGDLATVATSGSYNDLSNKPTIPAAQVNSDWNASSGVAQILNKPTLGTAAAADTTAFASASQGTKADSAIQSVKVNGSALTPDANKAVDITVPAAQVQSDWNATEGMGVILNKPSIPSTAADVGAVVSNVSTAKAVCDAIKK